MFFNSFTSKNGYNLTIYTEDISLHSGIPKQFYSLKNKTFSDWKYLHGNYIYLKIEF